MIAGPVVPLHRKIGQQISQKHTDWGIILNGTEMRNFLFVGGCKNKGATHSLNNCYVYRPTQAHS